MFGGKRDIFILIVLQIVLGMMYLGSVPRIYVDEVWDSSLGYNLAHQGKLSHPFVEGYGGMHINFIQNRVVLPFVNAAIFKIVDYSIATSRIGSVLFGALAVSGVYGVMRRWFGAQQAFWAGLATIIYPWFFDISRRARPEIYYTALALVFLWLLMVYFDTGTRRIALFAGAAAGLSALTHPNGLIIISSISLAVIIWCRTKPVARLIQWGCVGFFLVVLPYIIYVLWAIRNPEISFIKQMQVGMLHRSMLQGEIFRWKSFSQWPKGLPLTIIILVSWAFAWYRSSAADKILATIIILFALTLPFATVSIAPRYLAAITPFFCALIVRFIWRVMTYKGVVRQNWHKFCFAINACTAFIYLSTCLTFIGLMFYYLRGADFTKITNRVGSVVSHESRVYGNPIFWVGHDLYQYGPWIYKEDITLKEAIRMLRRHNFDYIIRTAWFIAPPGGFSRPPKIMPKFTDNSVVDWACRIYGTKIDEFYDPYYGPIEIYKINWDSYYRIGKER